MDVTKTFGIDPKAETEGVWFNLGEGGKVKIARVNSPSYKRSFQSKVKSYQQALQSKVLDEVTAEMILVEVIQDTILMDWRNFTIDGEELVYSKENAIMMLTRFSVFRDFVVASAEQMNVFKLKQQEEVEGNLGEPSTGSSSGGQMPISSIT